MNKKSPKGLQDNKQKIKAKGKTRSSINIDKKLNNRNNRGGAKIKDLTAPPTTQIILPGKADDRILGLVAENCPQLQVGQNSNKKHVFLIQKQMHKTVQDFKKRAIPV